MRNRFFSDAPVEFDETLSKTLKVASAPETTALQYRVELITPLFGGGTMPGDVDLLMPFRAKSIRGHLRFWWRLLAHEGVFAKPSWWNNNDDAAPEEHDRFKRWERQVWGGVRGSEVVASAVGLEVVNKKQITPVEYEQARFRAAEIFRGAEYALFSAQSQADRLTRKLMSANEGDLASFDLVVSIKAAQAAGNAVDQVKETIRCWATFGGIGSRTRRGLGSLKVTECTENDTQGIVCVDLTPSFGVPKFGNHDAPGLRVAKGNAPGTADQCWKSAVGVLRDFRQGPGIARVRKGGMPGRSFWPEPDAIRVATGQHLNAVVNGVLRQHIPANNFAAAHSNGLFPRAAFGLPIVVQFKDKQIRDRATGQLIPHIDKNKCDPDQVSIEAIDAKRMASPLIIKACVQSDGNFYPIAVLLPSSREITDKLTVKIAGKMVPAWTTKMANDFQAEKAFAPIQAAVGGVLSAHDPLEAFLNYFKQRL